MKKTKRKIAPVFSYSAGNNIDCKSIIFNASLIWKINIGVVSYDIFGKQIKMMYIFEKKNRSDLLSQILVLSKKFGVFQIL